MHLRLTVVVVVISSVTTFSVSTTEIYPRRLAMAKAVLPFWREKERRGRERGRERERAEREGCDVNQWAHPPHGMSQHFHPKQGAA